MNRYEQRLHDVRQRQEGALVPFVVLGDPTPADSLAIIRGLIEAGADALELGLPFSDPVADGPTIQQAMVRALATGWSTDQYLQLIAEIRSTEPEIPIGLLVYANLIEARGRSDFYHACAAVGVDSVLVADVPLGECKPYCAAARAAGIEPVLLCPPNIDAARLDRIAQLGGGYTYVLSRAGVTGTEVGAGRPVEGLLEQLRQRSAAPPFVGFGIRGPADVAAALAAGAAGVICGSAIIERIAAGLPDRSRIIADLQAFVRQLKQATHPGASGGR